MWHIERKTDNKHPVLQRILYSLIAIIVAGLVIAACGYNPVTMYTQMVKGSFNNSTAVEATFEKMIPLLIMALGVAVCFKMKFMNIGTEGQFYMGATAATWVALFSPEMLVWVKLILMFLLAFLAGGLWCFIAAALKSRWGVSETLVTLMLNYVAIKLVSYLQYVKWKDGSFGQPKIANYPKALQFPSLFGVNIGWIIAIIVLIVVYLLLKKSKFGYEISVIGDSEETARYAGMKTKRNLLIASLIGGGICGLAGLIQAAGVEHTMNASMTNGMGYSAIVIAYMANMNPFSILVVSFLFSILYKGSAYIKIALQIPSATADIVQGVILLFVLASEFFANFRFVRTKKGGA